ncbi:MAG: peptidylprolyl isomerase [Acidobacteria bacterium]|nr:peptidylprolyl isomerase [Acidobacteriota bacterium]
MQRKSIFLAIGLLALVGCSSEKPAPPKEAATPATPAPTPAPATEAPKAPPAASFKVAFETTKGSFIVEVHPDWAPIGAARFKELVEDKFFDGAGFFRVVPNFMVQFGLAADPAKTKKWDTRISDDPVIRTNKRGAITFATAGPNTRTSQLFINFKSNQFLDDQGFAPFGEVTGAGMDVVDKITAQYGESPDQGAITAQGNAYLKSRFPNLDFIKKATIVP